jgi:glycine cleavage system H protein
MDLPRNLRYAKSHEWASEPDDGVVTVGITDFAQDQLGDVVYVELPEVGEHVDADQPVAVVESVKTASDIYAPVSGTIVEVNEDLDGTPENINTEPYGKGWLFRIEPDDVGDLDGLLDAAGYEDVAEEG